MEDAVEELKTLQRVVAPDTKIISTNLIKQVSVIFKQIFNLLECWPFELRLLIRI